MGSNSALVILTQQLVERLAPALDESSRSYAADYCLREVQDDVKGGTRREWPDVVTALARWVHNHRPCHLALSFANASAERSARVRVQDDLAEGLQRCVKELDSRRKKVPGWEGDMPVKVSSFGDTETADSPQMSNLPQHMQLLVCRPGNITGARY